VNAARPCAIVFDFPLQGRPVAARGIVNNPYLNDIAGFAAPFSKIENVF